MTFFVRYLMTHLFRLVPALLMRFVPALLVRHLHAALMRNFHARLVWNLPALLVRFLPTLLMRNLLTLSSWLLPTFLHIVAVFNRNLLAVLAMLNVLAHFLTLLALTKQLVQLVNNVALLFSLRSI